MTQTHDNEKAIVPEPLKPKRLNELKLRQGLFD